MANMSALTDSALITLLRLGGWRVEAIAEYCQVAWSKIIDIDAGKVRASPSLRQNLESLLEGKSTRKPV